MQLCWWNILITKTFKLDGEFVFDEGHTLHHLSFASIQHATEFNF